MIRKSQVSATSACLTNFGYVKDDIVDYRGRLRRSGKQTQYFVIMSLMVVIEVGALIWACYFGLQFASMGDVLKYIAFAGVPVITMFTVAGGLVVGIGQGWLPIS